MTFFFQICHAKAINLFHDQISKLFNGKRPTQSGSVVDRAVKVHRSEVVGDDIGLHVVDTPGFCENESSNGELVMALTSFLNRDLPCRIPTVTFIVARVDDDDIEKREQSQFAHMLKSLSQVENLITDQHYSNLVLLLTHSQSAKNLSEATKKYQNEFAQVFPVTNPISVIAIENFRYRNRETVSADSFQKSYHQTIFGELTELARKRQEHSLHTLMSWLTEKARRFSVSFQQDIFPIESLSKQTVHQEEIVILRPDFLPYFVMHLLEEPTKRRKSTKKSKSQASDQQQLLLTCIPPGSQITLADKSIISVDKCLVGDKVLGIHSTASVITAVRQATVEEIVTEGKTIGSIYCCAVDETKDDKVAGKLIYMNDNGLLELVDPSRANVPEKSAMETFYFLELDNPNGTFVVNGFHCFASVEKGSLNNTSI